MENLMSIGKMAEINHSTVATLRLYDQKNLLKPEYTDPFTGYRYYTIQQNYRLDMITYMKELGMSLYEIKKVFEKEDLALIEEILSEKNEQIHRQIRKLKEQHNAVERAIASIERYRKSPRNGTITLEYIDRRRIWKKKVESNFYEKGIEDFEMELMKLREALISKNVYMPHTYNVCTTVKREDFLSDHYIPDEIFVIVDHNFAYEKETLLLDSGMYLCIYVDNYDDEIPYLKVLKEYCLEHRYTIAGDYICEILTEFNVFNKKQRSMYLRLQVPVKFEKD